MKWALGRMPVDEMRPKGARASDRHQSRQTSLDRHDNEFCQFSLGIASLHKMLKYASFVCRMLLPTCQAYVL